MDSLKEYAEHVVNGGILDRTERLKFLAKFNEAHGTNHQEDGTMAQIYHCVKEIVEPEKPKQKKSAKAEAKPEDETSGDTVTDPAATATDPNGEAKPEDETKSE